MKKLLLSAVAFASLFTANYATAQLADGTTAPDWTFTDINGTSWNLYSLTAQGKTVFIDVSATWCGPCWNYHSGHALKELYLEHGPTGTLSQDVMVFFIEGDNTTTSADLNGTGTNTQGDWVTGTPYPIIDLQGSAETTFNNNYAIAGFPTIYKVCPNNKIYEVGQQNAAGLVNSINSCPFPTDAYTSAGPVTLQCSGTFAPTVSLKNNGQSDLTSCNLAYAYDGGTSQTYNWTGTLAAGQSTTITLPQQTFTAGTHSLEVTTSNPNGGADNNNTNNIQTYSFTISNATPAALPLSNSFTTSTFPYTNWILENADNGTTWARVSTNSGSLKYDCFNYSAAGQKDAFVIEPVSLTSTVNPSLNFKVAHARYSASYTEKLEVFVSTDCGQTWTSKWVKSGAALATAANTTSAFTPTSAQWRAECVDLSSYAGQAKVFVKFVGTNSYGNNVYVDDISISDAVCVAAGIDEQAKTTTFSVYPNPAKDMVQVDLSNLMGSYTVEVMDLQGRILSNQSGSASGDSAILSISLEGVAKGTYMISVYNNNSKESKTIVVE